MQMTPATATGDRRRERRRDLRARATSPTPTSTFATGPTTCATCSTPTDGNLVAALAAYNAGSGNVDDWGGSRLEIGDIRFEETRAYVEQVLDEREQYRDNYAEDLGL